MKCNPCDRGSKALAFTCTKLFRLSLFLDLRSCCAEEVQGMHAARTATRRLCVNEWGQSFDLMGVKKLYLIKLHRGISVATPSSMLYLVAKS